MRGLQGGRKQAPAQGHAREENRAEVRSASPASLSGNTARNLSGKSDGYPATVATGARRSKTEMYGTRFAETADDLGSYCSHAEQ
jgi:hypothetical protein